MMADRPPTGFVPPEEEPAEDACQALVHLLRSRPDMWIGDDGQVKRSLLIADYARQSRRLTPPRLAWLDRQVIESFLPEATAPREQATREREDIEVVDVAVMTVIREELDAVLEVFDVDDRRYRTFAGQRFYRASVETHSRSEPLSVVITAAGAPLNVHIHRPVNTLFEHYQPQMVILLGIAAGVEEKVALGDVIVCRRVMYYSAGRLAADGDATIMEPRPQHAQSSDTYGYGMFYYNPQRTNFRNKVTEYLAGLPAERLPNGLAPDHRPEIFADNNVTIAAGGMVLRDGRFLPELRRRFDNTILAADMESYGFSQAVSELPWLVFRGISDHGDPEQRQGWKDVASAFAALCLKDFLETQYLPPGAEVL